MASKKKAWGLIAARTVLGGCLLLFGLNQFHGLLGATQLNAEALEFIQALQNTGYLFYVIKGIELVGGCLLLSGLFVPLANLILFPVLLNILLFHTFLDPRGLPVAIVMALCSIAIFWYYKKLFMFLLRYNIKIDPNSLRENDVVPDVKKV